MSIAIGTLLLAWLARQSAEPGSDEPAADEGAPGAAKEAPPIEEGPPPFVFTEVAKASGIDLIVECGEPGKPRLIDQTGMGIAGFDYDRDGRTDVYFANGSTLAAWQGKEANLRRPRLYRNLGGGNFADVTEKAGLLSDRWGSGPAVGDIDNDGDLDLYVACVGPNLLYRNQGDGTFVEEAAGKPVAFPGVTPGAVFGDMDLDGDLDLYVSAYLEFDLAAPPRAYGRKVRELDVSLAPNDHRGAADRFFVNDGKGAFADATRRFGFLPTEGEHGFTALLLDMSGDDLPDLFVANDRTPNLYYRSKRPGLVEEVADECNIAVSPIGKSQACMGIAVADLNDDLLPDLMVTNFQGETNAAYVSQGDGTWEDRIKQFEKACSSRVFVGWGVAFADLDCDGAEECLVVNGHVNPQLETEVPQVYEYLQRPLLYTATRREDGTRAWREVARSCGSLAERHSARGLSVCDYDDDGDLDFAISDVDGPIRLFRNDTPARGHFLRVEVEGGPLAGGGTINRDGYGARVTLEAGGKRQTRWVLGAGSYLSHHDPRPHFGLGETERVDSLVVRWPGGREERIAGPLPVDRTLVVRAGVGLVAEIVNGERREIAPPPSR
ncbi:MAG: CRTAC1 family protein [Planctomycetes bacterium]|nr:CRTAC1 family protein [Planctomycetota bacterium]